MGKLASERALWHRAQKTDAPQDESEAFLDLAAFAEGRLDAEEEERVAALLAGDPEAFADIEAARALAREEAAPAPEGVIHRALAALPPAPSESNVLPFARPRRLLLGDFARWGSLAAATALAGWFGFSMGSGATHALLKIGAAGAGALLPHLFDPATGFLHELAASMLP